MALRPEPSGYVLVVDDVANLSELIAELLKMAGYRTRTAGNGLEALAYLQSSEPPALILLDLNMPVMDGWEFRARQQQDPLLNRIPVVILSAEAALPEQAASLRAAGYLPKPSSLDDLLRMVRRHFPVAPEPRAVR